MKTFLQTYYLLQTTLPPWCFQDRYNFFVNSFCFDWAQLGHWRWKLKFVFACFSNQNSSGFNSPKASELHSQPVVCKNDLFDPFVTVHFTKLEMVFVRLFLSHCCRHFGAQIRVEMAGCKQMKVIVAHHMIWWMHPCCQLEPKLVDFHESNENQAKSPPAWVAKSSLTKTKWVHKNFFVPVSKKCRVASLQIMQNVFAALISRCWSKPRYQNELIWLDFGLGLVILAVLGVWCLVLIFY